MATLTKRQKQLVDYLENYINEHGYAPTLAEVGEFFGLSSLATVHKHLRNLESKGFIKRQHNHSRALEIAQRRRRTAGAQELSLLGQVAAGQPIEAIEGNETISVPEDFVRRDNTFCLRVRGESMVDDGIRDGDYIIVEGRDSATNGETVVALVGKRSDREALLSGIGWAGSATARESTDGADICQSGRLADSRRGGGPDAALPLNAGWSDRPELLVQVAVLRRHNRDQKIIAERGRRFE